VGARVYVQRPVTVVGDDSLRAAAACRRSIGSRARIPVVVTRSSARTTFVSSTCLTRPLPVSSRVSHQSAGVVNAGRPRKTRALKIVDAVARNMTAVINQPAASRPYPSDGISHVTDRAGGPAD